MIDVSDALRRALSRMSSDTRVASSATEVPVGGGFIAVGETASPAGSLQARDFIEIRAQKRRNQQQYVTERFWTGIGNLDFSVISPSSGQPTTRFFIGAGGLLSIQPIPRTRDLTAPRISVTLSQLSAEVLEVVQRFNARGARVRVWRGVFDPGTRTLVDAAMVRFSGSVEQVNIETPSRGETGQVEVVCTSELAQLTRGNVAKRANGTQTARLRGDGFFKDAGVVPRLRINWGGSEASAERALNGRRAGTGGASWSGGVREEDAGI